MCHPGSILNCRPTLNSCPGVIAEFSDTRSIVPCGIEVGFAEPPVTPSANKITGVRMITARRKNARTTCELERLTVIPTITRRASRHQSPARSRSRQQAHFCESRSSPRKYSLTHDQALLHNQRHLQCVRVCVF